MVFSSRPSVASLRTLSKEHLSFVLILLWFFSIFLGCEWCFIGLERWVLVCLCCSYLLQCWPCLPGLVGYEFWLASYSKRGVDTLPCSMPGFAPLRGATHHNLHPSVHPYPHAVFPVTRGNLYQENITRIDGPACPPGGMVSSRIRPWLRFCCTLALGRACLPLRVNHLPRRVPARLPLAVPTLSA